MKIDLDLNGKRVHAFTIQVENLGFAQLTSLILEMFRSGSWLEFRNGLGVFKFFPGEFDYFLTQRGMKREDLIHGIRDIRVKAELEKGMDERRTGEADYRRTIEQARNEIPEIPGRPIMPFGITKSESKYLKFKKATAGSPFGPRVRHFTLHGKKGKPLPVFERLINALEKLKDNELEKLIDAAKREQQRRRRRRKNIRLVG